MKHAVLIKQKVIIMVSLVSNARLVLIKVSVILRIGI
jgi:hypothetical protein